MALFGTRTKAQLQEMQSKYAAAESARAAAEAHRGEFDRIREALERQVAHGLKVQEMLTRDILTLQEVSSTLTGNDYPKYEAAVKAISEKYVGTAPWGCLQTGTTIDLRAAFILGDGIKVVKRTETKEEAKGELQWAKDFFEYNGLDAEMAQALAKEAEIEGKIALRLFWDDGPYKGYPGMVSVRFLSWYSKRYKVIPDPDDYLWYKRITWNAQGGGAAGNVGEEEFVYKKFGGRINDPNDAQPKIMKCLTQIDRLDRALRDLREIDHLFASPTPDFECATAKEAMELLQHIDKTNWKIGKAFAHIGKYSLKGPEIAGVTCLISEIEMNVKMISGATGIPIHYYGLLDLLKNRATGNDMRELINAATTSERVVWVGAFEELLDKAMAMFNAKTGLAQKSTEGGKLDPEKIGVEIPQITQEHWDHIEKVLIPAATGGIISKEYAASQIPNLDQEEEAERKEVAEAGELERAKLDLERMRQEAVSGGIGGGGAGA
jgi:hypothetical protein